MTLALLSCGGPEKLGAPLLGSAGAGGRGGIGGAAGDLGVAGTTGAAGTDQDAGADLGTGAAGTMGAAGTGAAGTTGVAGTTGAAGTRGAAGTTGAAGTGAAGTGAAGTGGTPDAGTDTAPPGCNCMLKVQYQCRQNGASVPQAEYSIKIVNTGTTAINLNAVTVRYWYTSDGTGTQSGNCASAAHPCTIAFVNTPQKPTADHYAVISFGGGSLAPGADTDEISIQMRGMGTYMQPNDFSFLNTGANYPDQPNITAYVAGKLMWGAPP